MKSFTYVDILVKERSKKKVDLSIQVNLLVIIIDDLEL